MTFRKAIGKIHLWLGLASGVIVVFLGITGCILAFEQEVRAITETYRYVTPAHTPQLAPDKIKQIATAALPGKLPHGIAYYANPGKAVQVSFYNIDPAYYYLVYVNPYNGQVLKVKDANADFFRIVVMGHYYLWLPPAVGQPIVATATLIFLIMLISGLILWWPKNKAARKQRFSVKWNATFKRKNYDLHNVLGFYMTWVAIFIAVTGLVWGFQWFAKSVYWTASGGKEMVQFYEAESEKPAVMSTAGTPMIDRVWQKMKLEHTNAAVIEVHVPANDSAAIEAVANPDDKTYWKADYRYFDQYTMKEIDVTHSYGRFPGSSVADKMIRMNYDVHTGAILGITGKIMAFFASLIAASLPITGFFIWKGRKKKKQIIAAPQAVKRQLVPASQ
ncbi:PepSY domain-containing protein [Panacibacter sp. DH6]|uniref:PepSY domain-containing protein n=1 Tax=Panacibacter microcysteis TaxID=2793269 RepID=A0A931E1W0_9BACT|nr:PepSY-associated TM helix domain-containing protein [Panacibacter microcysteis]MBG9375975.1 PepSY domain-containing protein [Panacibacter microcysteis]